MGPHNCGVPRERVSGYHKFEGLDPAEWSERGYAIVNIDSRGIGDSEGDAIFWGQQVGRFDCSIDLIANICVDRRRKTSMTQYRG